MEKTVDYLKGLAKGLKISDATPEGELLLAMIEVLDSMHCDIADNANELKELNDYVEEIDSDLMSVEEDLYDDDEDYEYCDGCECEGDCDHCDCDGDCDTCTCGEDDCDCEDCDCDDLDYQEYECPQCREKVCFSGEFSDDELVCPNCGSKLK